MSHPDYAAETDVLIVGSGPSGASMALALATYGVPHIMVTKHRWTRRSAASSPGAPTRRAKPTTGSPRRRCPSTSRRPISSRSS
jgi:2-polyprenyl-6-methoxyphenol hydroxylase-like FAD-dependent oxidoreductase